MVQYYDFRLFRIKTHFFRLFNCASFSPSWLVICVHYMHSMPCASIEHYLPSTCACRVSCFFSFRPISSTHRTEHMKVCVCLWLYCIEFSSSTYLFWLRHTIPFSICSLRMRKNRLMHACMCATVLDGSVLHLHQYENTLLNGWHIEFCAQHEPSIVTSSTDIRRHQPSTIDI